MNDARDEPDTPDQADDLWRSIVDNYGERPELDEPEPTPPPVAEVWTVTPAPSPTYADDDTVVPPPPPPLPVPAPDRMLAWSGVFGAPAVLLISLVLRLDLPTIVAYVLVAWFVGGFCYLVAKMPREPREPWDDGAQV